MRKKNDALRGILLTHAQDIVTAEGTAGLNIRRLATRAGIAPGTVYHYFKDKDTLLLAITENGWRGSLRPFRQTAYAGTFSQKVRALHASLTETLHSPAGRLMLDLGSAREAGRERMALVRTDVRALALDWLLTDSRIRPDLWQGDFTPERMAEFVTDNLFSLLTQNEDCLRFFLDILDRILENREG
ncbi:MAG: TetR/AcrR family transcriptional regulator [Clostridiales bacterium]|nr:TetR/AcrR family transcriptional regulator [Clostridiales bacterium]